MPRLPFIALAMLLAGCFGEGDYTYMDIRPVPGASEFIEFTDEEYNATPHMRFLRGALERAAEGNPGTRQDDVNITNPILRELDERWATKYGTKRNDEGQALATPRIVKFHGETYRVLLVSS